MILARFPSTFLAWIVGTWNCKQQQFRRLSVDKVLSTTQGKAMDKGCLLDLSILSAEVAGCPRAILAPLPGGWNCGSVWGHAGPSPLGAQVSVFLPVWTDQSLAWVEPGFVSTHQECYTAVAHSRTDHSNAPGEWGTVHLYQEHCSAPLHCLASAGSSHHSRLLKARCCHCEAISIYVVQCYHWATLTTPVWVI